LSLLTCAGPSVLSWPVVLRAVSLLAVAVLGLSFALQGWRSRFLPFDLVPYTDEAAALLAAGRLPEKGTLTSFGSYSPPGIAWLLAPGMALMEDPRLYESIGAAVLYVGTLVGVFALTALCAPQPFALLAAALWGLSESGIFFAHSLWPRGHPFFFVWMAYFTLHWVRRRNAWYFAAALVTSAAGTLVFLEIAPALTILPALWWFYRPPIDVRHTALAVAVALLLWFPYLRFESTRGFNDLRSQLYREAVHTELNAGWCDPSMIPAEWNAETTGPEQSGAIKRAVATVANRIKFGPPMAIANFRSVLPGAWILLAVGIAAALAVPALVSLPGIFAVVFQVCGVLLVAGPIAVNEWTVARFLSADGRLDAQNLSALRIGGLVALLLGAGLLLYAKRLHEYVTRARAYLADAPGLNNLKLVAICLALPWAAQLLVVEGPRPERFWWLWGLQTVVLAGGLAVVRATPICSALAACVLVAVTANDLSTSRIQSWAVDGWAGKDNAALPAIDYVAQSMIGAGVRSAAIGYEVEFDRFMATFHGVDSRYKVGKELDFVLLRRHGLTNTNRCAEGLSSADAYRIVEHPRSGEPRERFRVVPDLTLRPIYSDPSYTVLAK
jgi:hypothetical protein